MIRKIGLLAFFTCVTIHGLLGQSFYRDSLETKLEIASNPIERFEILDRILLNDVGFQATNVDSARCLQLLEIAQKLNNDSLLATSYNWIGSYFSSNKGDNATGLEYYYKALPFAQKANDLRRVSSLYFDIAFAYFDLLNPQAALINTQKGGQNLPDPSHPLYHFMLIQYQLNMGYYYATIGNLDSTLFYADKIEITNAKEKSVVMKYNALVFRATAEAGFGNIEKAEMVFKEAMALENDVQRNQARLYFYKQYIEFLITTGRIEDAMTLSHSALKLGLHTNNNPIQLVGAGYLRRINEMQGLLDSAYYYARHEAQINDLIYSQTNTNKIQALVFNEELRVVENRNREIAYQSKLRQYGLLSGLFMILLIAIILFRGNRQKQAVNVQLGKTLEDLRSTQSQLIQSEKMASLGELTAGIAHEIQNPLNFVNNFSEVSNEMIKEILDTRHKTQDQSAISEEDEMLNDIAQNLEKINHHGKRAGEIVKGMLQHSRVGSGKKEPTDINALCDEYLRLAYHGLRAKDKSFNAKFETDFDTSLEKINVIPQDIGRVVLNLINNAFYAVHVKTQDLASPQYTPTVNVSTKHMSPAGGGKGVVISVKDNGNGIPEHIKEKIFQPFFTTKPTGQGTGLGLSLSYDIVKAHGGELKVETVPNQGSLFIIHLPNDKSEC